MQFRRSGQRDERRRRVILEETGAYGPRTTDTDVAERARSRPRQPLRRYSDDTLATRQPRLIDLIPRRRWTLTVLALALLSIVAGLEALYGKVAIGATPWTTDELPAINLLRDGNVGQWFCAVLMGASAVVGWVIYLVRRHRVDDYRGRYRMWYWVVPLLVLASLDRIANVQGTLWTVMYKGIKIPWPEASQDVWQWLTVSFLMAASLRVALEIRGSRLALTAWTMATFGFVGLLLFERGWFSLPSDLRTSMAVSSLTMTSHALTFLGLVLYARHVCLEASGMDAAPRRTRSKRTRPSAERPSDGNRTTEAPSPSERRRRVRGKVLRTDSAHAKAGKESAGEANGKRRAAGRAASQPAAPSKSEKTAPAGTPHRSKTAKKKALVGRVQPTAQRAAGLAHDDPGDLDDDDQTSQRKLSKSERRRLRKQRRRERQDS